MSIRAILSLAVTLALAPAALAQTTKPADRVDELFISGDMKSAEAGLEKMLAADPKDDHARFGLGTAQVLLAVEDLFQSLNTYGFLRSIPGEVFGLPTDLFSSGKPPKPVTAADVRKLIAGFNAGLGKAEATLAAIKSTDVKLPLHFGLIHLDLNGDGKADDSEALGRLFGQVSGERFEPADVAAFTIGFDAADAEWLRGYCNLLMALTDFMLAHDGGDLFDHTAQLFFPNARTPFPYLRDPSGPFNYGGVNIADAVAFIHLLSLPVAEPARMKSALEHLQAMTAHSRKMWQLAMAETDDDNEWIPNPKQHSVLPGVRITLEMVDGWKVFLDEVDAILAGKKLIPFWRGKEDQGVNIRRVFTEPKRFDLVLWVQGSAAAPYLEKGPLTKEETWDGLMRLFRGNFIGFAIWFN